MNMQDDPTDPEDDSLSDMLDGAPSTSPHLPVDGQQKQRVVVLTGAGISAESGLRTFRGSDGLWEGHRVHDGDKCLRRLHSDSHRLYTTFVLLD